MPKFKSKKTLHIIYISTRIIGYPEITKEEVQQIEHMLEKCIVIDINNTIKSEVIRLRRTYSLKLPDCIIAATAVYLDVPIRTSDKDFKKIDELYLMLYEK